MKPSNAKNVYCEGKILSWRWIKLIVKEIVIPGRFS